jgi:molybdate transport system substrate-binding protein
MPPAQAQETPLRIAAAADLQPVLPPILEEFRKTTGIQAEATYQASAALTAQILNGAPFDLFLSADLSYPQRLIDAHVADTAGSSNTNAPIPSCAAARSFSGPARTATGPTQPSRPCATPRSIGSPSPTPTEPRMAAPPSPRSPASSCSMSSNQSSSTAENISQAAQFAETGNADAGLLSLTSAKTEHLAAIGSYFVLPSYLYPPIQQGAVLVTNSSQRQNASKFLDFLLSAPIQQQLAKSGLTSVK